MRIHSIIHSIIGGVTHTGKSSRAKSRLPVGRVVRLVRLYRLCSALQFLRGAKDDNVVRRSATWAKNCFAALFIGTPE